MQTDTLKRTEPADHLSWGLIELQVTHLERSVAFWTDAIGIQVRSQDSEKAELGTSDKTLVTLHAGATFSVSPRYRGMYHIAIGVPDQNELSRILARFISKGIGVAPTDHLASKSLYISDPDGLEIEIVLETPERFGRFGDMSRGLVMYSADGQPHSGREALDVRAELVHAQGADLEAPLSDGAIVAHMHFKVGDLEPAVEWFEGIGFTRNLLLPNWGFGDLSAGPSLHHRLAMNVWQSKGSPAAPEGMARLLRYKLHVHSASIIDNALGFAPAGDGLVATDPAGVEVTLVPAFVDA